ncbi:MFS transporter [Svornostia abyssi]|uniref:MFS transporter n=1 Tax=Svornostia abyssi TaxID=2898438 RepID=A0ABY5PH36_9ACTN|nr:MFS transporter [Parviterribacteraceae bacterium J379]
MPAAHRHLTLAALCLCAFAVNLDVTLVNVTLPTLVRELDASTRELQWIVDAYTLVFAALVLAAGSLGDRFGRRGTLLAGLAVYGIGNGLGSLTDSSEALIATRAIMGVGAALIFPTTLSIITNVFTERGERARAIGLWGAVTGLAIALGPIAGGALLESFSWQSTFLAKVPVALVAIALVLWVVPTSRDPRAPRLDIGGLVLSTAFIGTLVFAIIEAPDAGWLSTQTVGLLAIAFTLGGIFIAFERRVTEPMLDVRIFRNLRFSAASVSITVAFFALAGFIFLITQYFQFLKGYGPLETGLRILPVATSVAVGSVVGTQVAVRRGTKLVVGGGLAMLAVAYAWTSTADATTAYTTIVWQMLFLGTGMGLTSAPATESIMGAVSQAKAGIGSAINDAARELGATLGVAVIGSVYASLYADAFAASAARAIPGEAVDAARESVGAAIIATDRLGAAGASDAGGALFSLASQGFFDGMQAGCLVAAGVCAAGAVLCLLTLPAQPDAEPAEDGAPAVAAAAAVA